MARSRLLQNNVAHIVSGNISSRFLKESNQKYRGKYGQIINLDLNNFENIEQINNLKNSGEIENIKRNQRYLWHYFKYVYPLELID